MIPSIRISRQAIAATVAIALASCTDVSIRSGSGASPKASSSDELQQISSQSGSEGNPFAVFSYTSDQWPGARDLECVRTRLDLSPLSPAEALSGTLQLQNDCDSSVAVLTAPIELRLKLDREKRLPFEAGGVNQVYALAYIFLRDLGFGARETFLGDGGLTVSTLPDFAVVQPASTLALAISSGEPLKLESGEYGLALMTILVPVRGREEKPGSFDLRQSVQQLEASRERSRELRLPPEAARVSSLGYFEVTEDTLDMD